MSIVDFFSLEVSSDSLNTNVQTATSDVALDSDHLSNDEIRPHSSKRQKTQECVDEGTSFCEISTSEHEDDLHVKKKSSNRKQFLLD